MKRDGKIQAHVNYGLKDWLAEKARRVGYPSLSAYSAYLLEQSALRLGCPTKHCNSHYDNHFLV